MRQLTYMMEVWPRFTPKGMWRIGNSQEVFATGATQPVKDAGQRYFSGIGWLLRWSGLQSAGADPQAPNAVCRHPRLPSSTP